MKHTKKRAILSAVAMLVVSAIALSSATFAWFTAGDKVKVTALTAKVTAQAGSILISGDNGQTDPYDNSLDPDEIVSIASNIIPANLIAGTAELKPVSVNLPTGSIFNGTLAQDETTLKYLFNSDSNYGGNGTGRLIKYKVFLKYDAPTGNTKTVTVTPTFLEGAIPYLYAGIVNGGSSYLYGTATHSYFPVIKSLANVEDKAPLGILDAADSSAGDLGLVQTVTNTTSFTITLSGGVEQSFDVYVWAEGQDSTCTGVASAGSCSFSIAISA